MSVAVQGGKITEVTLGLQAPAAETVDAGGYLLALSFCDPNPATISDASRWVTENQQPRTYGINQSKIYAAPPWVSFASATTA